MLKIMHWLTLVVETFLLFAGILLAIAGHSTDVHRQTTSHQDLTGIYYVDSSQFPGALYRYNPTTDTESIVFTRQNGRFSSFTLTKFPDELFYAYGNDYRIFHTVRSRDGEWAPEEVIYTHTTYVRDIAFGPGPALYFSEASGCSDDGKVYRIDDATATLYYTVRLSDIGCWAGDFAFDEDGTLYLTTGNRVPASLYKIVAGRPERVYRARHSIVGLDVRNGIAYYTDFRQRIYYLDMSTNQEFLLYTKPSAFHLSEVEVLSITPSTLPTPTPTPSVVPTIRFWLPVVSSR